MHDSARSKSSKPNYPTRAKGCHLSCANARQYNVRKLRTMSTRGPLSHRGVYASRLAAKESFGDCEGKLDDILCRLQLARSILRTFHHISSSVLVDDSKWDGVDRNYQKRKGKQNMNELWAFFWGMTFGTLLASAVFAILKI